MVLCAVWGRMAEAQTPALAFLEDTSSLSPEARRALAQCVSDDPKAAAWAAESGGTVCALAVIPVQRSKNSLAQSQMRNSAQKRAQLRAATKLAVFLDDGRLNREYFSDPDAADYALRMSWQGRIKGGLQSYSRVMGETAVALAWAERSKLKPEPFSQARLTEDYSKFLYNRALELFKAGKFEDALAAFHQIRYKEWAKVKAYLGAAECFLKMGKPDDAGSLALELVQALSADMKPDEMAEAARILYQSERKDQGFNAMERAYRMVRGRNKVGSTHRD